MKKLVTIYALCDPETGEHRYVGKANNLKERVRCHLQEKRSDIKTWKVRWLRSLGDIEPLVVTLEIVPFAEWETAEKKWIKELRSQGARLTNFASGGQTSPVEGRGHSEETKQKLRENATATGMRPPSRKGKKVDKDRIPNMRRAARERVKNGFGPPAMGGWNKGKKMSPKYVEKNRQSHAGIPWSVARREAQNRRQKRIKEGS